MIPSNENVEDKVKNEKRLIYFGLVLAVGLGLISTILAILYGWDCFKDTDQVGLFDHSNVIILNQFPTPKVLLMDKVGKGHMITLKQNPNLSFVLDGEFKVPFTTNDVGYILFEDQSSIFVIPSSMDQKMKIIHPSSKEMYAIRKSHIPERFYRHGHLIKVGNFVMIFGGLFFEPGDSGYSDFSGYISINGDFKHPYYCSSSQVKNTTGLPKIYENVPSTALWSIIKQAWIKGPYLPIKGPKCFLDATSFAINR